MAKGGTTMILMACNVFRYCTLLRGLGSLMVLLVLAIVALTYYALVVTSYAPLFFSASSSLAQSACSLLVLLIFHVLLVMLLWSYFSVVLTDPGGVPPNWKPVTDEERGEALPLTAIEHGSSGVDSESAMVLIESLHPKVRYCRKCNQWKPPRCHHCSVCGRCILKMDHHCVWVVNCVGARNYKFFLLFLFYTFLETALVTLSLLPQFIAFFGDEEFSGTPGSLATTFIGFVLNLAFALSVLGFLIMHISLVARNTTTIEAYEKKATPKWKYDLGRRKNFEQVFGTNKIYWFIPLYCDEDMRKMPALNGLDYPSKPDMDTLQL